MDQGDGSHAWLSPAKVLSHQCKFSDSLMLAPVTTVHATLFGVSKFFMKGL